MLPNLENLDEFATFDDIEFSKPPDGYKRYFFILSLMQNMMVTI